MNKHRIEVTMVEKRDSEGTLLELLEPFELTHDDGWVIRGSGVDISYDARTMSIEALRTLFSRAEVLDVEDRIQKLLGALETKRPFSRAWGSVTIVLDRLEGRPLVLDGVSYTVATREFDWNGGVQK